MTIKENLGKALELLRTDGWVKGSMLLEPEEGWPSRNSKLVSGASFYGRCELGAIAAVLHPDRHPTVRGYDETPETQQLAAAITELFPDAASPHLELDVSDSVQVVASFNDAPKTTFDMVEQVFAKAMELPDEDGQ